MCGWMPVLEKDAKWVRDAEEELDTFIQSCIQKHASWIVGMENFAYAIQHGMRF